MIKLNQITLRRGQHVLLNKINWTIYHKQRVGLIGANGSGKTSLFALLLKEIEAENGELEMPNQLKLAHVAQETPALDRSALDFVIDGDNELRELESALERAMEENDGEEIGHLHEKLAVIDAYTAPTRAAKLLAGLSFTQEEQTRKVADFSGGWRVRLNLAKALMCRSDVLLLDEPTNHLDLDAVLWLEEWLKTYPGTLLLISHDRDFLDGIVDHIAYINKQQLYLYTGNYSSFETQHAQALMMQQATYEKQQKKLAHLQSFVDRFRAKASKAKQAQSRLKAIERMDLVCAVQSESPFQFEFKEPKECPNPLLKLEKAKIAYGDKVVLSKLDFSIMPKDRFSILGPNGAGKSSLIKLLAGEIPAAAGLREPSPGLKIGYFAQHQVDHLRLDESPIEHLRDVAENKSDLELRQFLGGFDFSGNRVFEPIRQFSGGEKSRLALALLVWQRPNLLLLDEPTNHLDLEMRQALSLALQEYSGAMMLVSHDRFLVRSTTDQFLLVADGRLQMFEGDLTDYQRWLTNYRKQQIASLAKNETKAPKIKPDEAHKVLLQKIRKLEQELIVLEKKFNAIEVQLAESTLYEPQNKSQLQEYLEEQAKLKQQIEATENAWLQAVAERDL